MFEDRPRRGRRLRLVPLACAGLLLTSCFEAPVRESLRLRFFVNGAVLLTSRIELVSDLRVSSAAIQARLREIRRSLADGTDPWSQRFAALDPLAERSSWEKKGGELTGVSHAAIVAEPDELARFFADTGLQVSYVTRPESGMAELTLVPGASTRASSRQRRDMDAVLASWAEDLAAYFADARAVYAYLDRQPERERAVLGNLFSDLLPEGTAPEPLSDEEQKQVKRLDDSMGRVLEVLQTGEGEAYSLDEISHLVYDPFPAQLELTLPAAVQEVEGFEKKGPDRLIVSGFGLWDALRSLEGRWIAPDVVSLYAASLTQEGFHFDLTAFLAQRRSFEAAPDPIEVREALVRALTPHRTYRAVWAFRPDEDPPADLWAD
jgi:hypothetical protein